MVVEVGDETDEPRERMIKESPSRASSPALFSRDSAANSRARLPSSLCLFVRPSVSRI